MPFLGSLISRGAISDENIEHRANATQDRPTTPTRRLCATDGPHEVAQWLGVSSGWVRYHPTRKTPRILVVKIGKLLRFQAEDIREFIESISGLEAERK